MTETFELHDRELSFDPAARLRPFVDAGLIARLPTAWQLVQGQLEMVLYVVLPDANDSVRYGGAPFGHPVFRQPFLIAEIGRDHLRVGHGLSASPEGLFKHLNFVLHVDYPVYDLQLIQTVPNGLERFRRYTQEIEDGSTPKRQRQRLLADMILPEASAYRRKLVERGGWLDRARHFDYPPDHEQPSYLRPEFSSLVGFVNYCARSLPERPSDTPLHRMPGHLSKLLLRRLLPEPALARA